MPRSHGHAGVVCEWPTKKACEAARRLAMGKCASQIEDRSEPRPCPNWAIDTVGDRGYCGQHFPSVVNRAIAARRRADEAQRIGRGIAHYMAWSGELPSVWDKFPDDWRETLPS